MAVKISKVVTPVPYGASGGDMMGIVLTAISQAQEQVRRESGIVLPHCTVKVVVEQEFEDGK